MIISYHIEGVYHEMMPKDEDDIIAITLQFANERYVGKFSVVTSFNQDADVVSAVSEGMVHILFMICCVCITKHFRFLIITLKTNILKLPSLFAA